MNRSLQFLSVVLIVLSLAACGGASKVVLRPDAKQSIKRIALIETPEPSRYSFTPARSTAAGGLMMFGAIGGALSASVEIGRMETATAQFTSAVSPLKPNLSGTLLAQLEKGLAAKGYQVVRVPPPPKIPDGKEYDFAKIAGVFDAFLVAELNGGYSDVYGEVSPSVFVSITLVSKSGGDRLFADRYLYSAKKFGDVNFVECDPKFAFKSVDAMYEDINTAVERLRASTSRLAERVVADL
jgi:hypothetical protein